MLIWVKFSPDLECQSDLHTSPQNPDVYENPENHSIHFLKLAKLSGVSILKPKVEKPIKTHVLQLLQPNFNQICTLLPNP
jgi:hypothetical protein